MQELAETAATAKQAELSSALSEKAALVEGLQTEVRTTREAQVTVSNESPDGLSAVVPLYDCPDRYHFRRGLA